MSQNTRVNAYEQEILEQRANVIVIEKPKANQGNVLSTSRVLTNKVRKAKGNMLMRAYSATANNKRALVLAFSTITFSIASIFFAVFLMSGKGFPFWLSFPLNLFLSGLFTFIFVNFTLFFVNLAAPIKKATAPKEPTAEEKRMMILSAMLKG